jgi:phosphoglycerate dehydrogenase-like enzyme
VGTVTERDAFAVEPRGTKDFLRQAVLDGGGRIVDVSAARGLVWTAPQDAAGLAAVLRDHPQIQLVQLPWAGIEPFAAVLDRQHVWCAGQGVYADDVAEHAPALLLAGLRQLPARARATSWQGPSGLSLRGARVTVFGAGGIAQSFARLLVPFDTSLTILRRQKERGFDGPGASRVLGLDERIKAIAGADAVVLALALTPLTRHVIGTRELQAMAPHAWLVNVARGEHVDTDALVRALAAQHIGGAALDVTAPEPLPPGHPLWSEPRCLITPHTANTPEMAVPVLSLRVRENVRRFIAGDALLGVVDVDAGY